MSLTKLLSALALAILIAPCGFAATPREELVRLVPEDVALCLEVHDLKTNGDKLMKSSWVKALQESGLGNFLGSSPELLQLAAIKKQLQQRLQIDWPQIRDEILGDDLILAYRPGPLGQPGQEQGLLLLDARNPGLLAKLMNRINDVQTKSGEIKELTTHEHKGFKFVQRRGVRGEEFYFLDGSVLAWTGQKAMLLEVLARRAESKVSPVPMLKHLRQAGGEKALASVWINPRALEPSLEAQAKELGETAEGKSLKTFLGFWRALDGISLSFNVDARPTFALAIHARVDALPDAARKLALESGAPSEVWQRLPAESILRLAARTDFEALQETLDQLLPGQTGAMDLLRKSVGLPFSKEFLKELAPHLGPDVGFCIAPSSSKDDFPHVFLALKIRPKPSEPGFDKNLVTALQFLAAAWIGDYNRKHEDQIQLLTLKAEGMDIRYLSNNSHFPKGFQPAFATKDGYLLVGSSPDALKRFKEGAASKDVAVHPLMRLSMPQLSTMVKDRREVIIGFLTQQRQLSKQQAQERFQALTAGLDLFHAAELLQVNSGNQVTWIFRLECTER